MAIEIERRFLVANDSWRPLTESEEQLIQGYVLNDSSKAVRVRIANEKAWLTVKGGTDVLNRLEFEYEIPVNDAREMLTKLCDDKVIDKIRHRIGDGDLTWEVDVFRGQNSGLVIAEVELPTADTPFDFPDWLGKEVSDDPRYLNARLLKDPWPTWNAE